MKNIKHILVICLFLTAASLSIVASLNLPQEKSVGQAPLGAEKEESLYFKSLKYYSISKASDQMFLSGSKLELMSDQAISFFNVKGSYQNIQRKLNFSSNKGDWSFSNKVLKLAGKVEVLNSQGLSHQSDFFLYDFKKEAFSAKGSTVTKIKDKVTGEVVEVRSSQVEANLEKKMMSFDGNVKAQIKRKRRYEGQVSLSAKKMQLDSSLGKVSLLDDVVLKRNQYSVRANKAEIFLENFNKKLKYYVLYDDIELTETLNTSESSLMKRRAFSEKLEGYIKENKIVLTGTPRVEQNGDVIKGYQITLRENIELVEVDDSQTRFQLKRN